MQNLTVCALQTEVHWHDASRNLAMFDEQLEAVSRDADVVVLPEMFSTGFTQQPELCAEPMSGPTVAWMARQASALDVALTGSVVIEEQGMYYNRLIWMQPDGGHHLYDKRHLFRMAGEHHHYAAGNQKLIVEYKGWRICPLICYDLRFPAWIRNQESYDLLIFVANWPKPRRFAWSTLLRARAIENIAYTVGVNRVGVDGNDVAYPGESAIVDYVGETMAGSSDQSQLLEAVLEPERLKKFRDRFPFFEDADNFLIER